MAWIKALYTRFGRKYRKNLKALYVVHPSTLIKVVVAMCRPFVSSKFWKKVQMVQSLAVLGEDVFLDRLDVPVRHGAPGRWRRAR